MSGIPTPPIGAPVVPARGALRPLGLESVRITGGFWGERQAVNGTATFPHILEWLEADGSFTNFDAAAAGTVVEERRGREFSDSDMYKVLEGMAWEIGRTHDADLEKQFRELVARFARVQEPDGYISTKFGRPGQGARWSDLEWGHELYCFGHLLQAAVARVRTRPDADDGLVEIARRVADLVCETFGPDGIDSICGHAEIELGLVEFGRAIGEPRYIEQAQLFVNRHGHKSLADIEFGRSYFQDDVPLIDAPALRGHAVRANYLAASAVDVAVDLDDAPLLDSLQKQWDRTIARRTYLTGGQGSHHQDEAFGVDWELPPDRAYAETCAGIASIMFSWRLLLETGEVKYADLIERTLFNVVATSPSRAGTAFFYSNPLQMREAGAALTDELSLSASSTTREPWFEVSCCPGNVARTLSSLDALVATVDDEGLQVHLYAPAEIRTTLPGGRVVAVDVETDYPTSGRVVLRIRETAEPFTLSLRVPEWAAGASVAVRGVDGQVVVDERAGVGIHSIRRAFEAGDVIELDLPMAPRVTAADPRIDAVRGTIAIERGPEVLALESVDFGGDVADAVIDATVAPVERDGRVFASLRTRSVDDAVWPYGAPEAESLGDAREVALVPYHDWAERGPSTMRVWIPVAPATTPQTATTTQDQA